ncbi:hypothetical protein BCD49_10695 [Pseudofrankia sp. EUN1h]|nr:hypothetical protein BCD49_10695 [Pseudofrankia sp. EUN1h]
MVFTHSLWTSLWMNWGRAADNPADGLWRTGDSLGTTWGQPVDERCMAPGDGTALWTTTRLTHSSTHTLSTVLLGP